MLPAKDVNGMASWSFTGAKMQNGARFANAESIRT